MATGIVVIALANRPRGDAIEYHTKGYMAASRGQVWAQKWSNGVKKMLGQPPRWRSDTKRMEYHERALIRLGYLDERVVIVSNSSPRMVQRAVYRTAWRSSGWVKVELPETNKVRIVAMKREMAELELAAHTADVREAYRR